MAGEAMHTPSGLCKECAHIGERIDLDLRRMICLDSSGSKERKREKEY